MPEFSYIAIDSSGKEAKDSLIADDTYAAMIEIRKLGLTPVKLQELGMFTRSLNLSMFKRKPKPRDISIFCRQFVSILEAGVSIVQALHMLVEQTESKTLAEILRSIRIAIEKGSSLSAAFQEHESLLGGSLFTAIVAAGEASGNLAVSFTRLAEQYEKDYKIRNMIKKAMIYPIVLLFVTIVVIGVVLVLVVPSFLDIFNEMGTNLPLITQIAIVASAFLQAKWHVVVAAALLFFIAVRVFIKTDTGKRVFDTVVFKLPLVGKLSKKSASSRMSRTLGTLLAGGIGLLQALEITAATMPNSLFREALESACGDVSKGEALSSSLKENGRFPPLVHQMLNIGEESGSTEAMLSKIADYYDEEVTVTTQQLTALMEPAIILVMAGVIALIVMSIMLPIAELYGNLQNL